MEEYKDPRILIVDDDPDLCGFFESAGTHLGVKTKSITQSTYVIDELRREFYNIVFLDIFMPKRSGFDLIPDIQRFSPNTKIIIITGNADKDIAITALKLGAFDFLEKPVKLEFISHSLKRALDIQKTEMKYMKTLQNLEDAQSDLLDHKERLENLNRKLIQTNRALTVMAQNIAREKEETEKSIVLKIRSLIIPIIEQLHYDKNLRKYKDQFSLFIKQMEDLTSGLATDIDIATSLSFSELRIACLIKEGLTTEKIADQLNVSQSTVKTHRKNIRKKLGISNHQFNLRNYFIERLKNSEEYKEREANAVV